MLRNLVVVSLIATVALACTEDPAAPSLRRDAAPDVGRVDALPSDGSGGEDAPSGSDGAVGGDDGAVGGSDGPVGGDDGAVGGDDGAVGGSDGAVGGSDGAVGGEDGAVGGSDGPVGGDDGAVGGDDGTVGGEDGAVGGSDGAVGGSDSSVGGDDGSIGGSDGAVGGSDGAVGGSDGSIGGSDGSVGGSDGSVGGSDGAVGGSDGAVSDAGPRDGGDASASDGAASDAGPRDGGDASASDGAVSDAGPRDGGDASASDGAVSDAGSRDGGDASASDGAASDAGDAGTSDGALEDPLSDFCDGSGTVVLVGAGGQCGGQIAEDLFKFGVCTCESAIVQSNLFVDAFDSRLGPYGAMTPAGANMLLEDGNVGVNGVFDTDGMVTLYGSIWISGGGFAVGQQSLVTRNLYANGEAYQDRSTTTIGRNMFVNGNVTAGGGGAQFDIGGDLYTPCNATVSARTLQTLAANGGTQFCGPIPPVEPCPCDDDEILDIAALTTWAATHNDNDELGFDADTWANGTGPDVLRLPCGRYYLTRIQHPRTLRIIAEGRTVLFVDGDAIFEGGLRLELEPGAEIDFFVRNDFRLDAASRLGSEERPAAVRTYIGGDETVIVQANSLFGGNFYAPRADVFFEASTDLFGSVFVRNVSFGGSADIHFDTAIRAAADECEPDAGGPDGGPDGGVGDAGTDASTSDAGGGSDAGSGDAGDAGSRDATADGGSSDGGDAGPRDATADGGSGDGGDAGPRDATADGGSDGGDTGPRDGGADAGTVDSGPDPISCEGCEDCGGGVACVRDPVSGAGMCGGCTSDLDCCAWEYCEVSLGTCFPAF